MNVTLENLLAGYDNADWCGFGYLGSRRNALESTDPEAPAQPEMVEQADAWLIDEANRRGWTAADLFEWANSKHGRWAGDVWFGGSSAEDRDRFLPGLLELPQGH